jgi:hypothetical protein
MAIFVERAAQDRAEKEAQSWKSRQWVMFCAKTIEAQAPDFWKDLTAAVGGLLEECGLPPEGLQVIPPKSFVIHQPLYPAVDVAVELDIPAETIRYTTVRRASREVEASRSERRFRFYLDDAGGLYLKQGDAVLNLEDAANLLLHPFVK